jgi:allantoinase
MKARGKRAFPQDKRLAVATHFPVEWWADPAADEQERYYQEYGAKTGAWRLLDLYDRVGVKATSHLNGMVAELFPDLAKAMVARGHDIAGHSYDQSHRQWDMEETDERAVVRRTLDRIESVTGYRPRGWICGGRRIGPNTVRILAEEGLAWHSHHDLGDLPSRVQVGERTIIDCPVQRYMNYNERRFLGFGGDRIRSCEEIFAFFKSQLDAMRGAARYEPLCFAFGAHAHMFGLPAYASGVQRMIEYALSCDDVWFATTDQLARYWCESD